MLLDNEEHRWECPYTNCKFFLLQYTSKGFEDKIAEHRAYHLQKMKEERQEREANKSWPFPPGSSALSGVAATLQRRQERQNKNYNKLVLTMYDMIMFELHAIKIDEDCVIDGYSGEYRS